MRVEPASRVLPLLGVLLASGAALAADPALPSTWRLSDVTIDGAADDWAGRLVPLERTPLSIGVENDGRFLFLCVRTSDEATRKQILARGLSLYMDASAKDHHGFGVRFPVGRGRNEHAAPAENGESGSARPEPHAAAGAELAFLGNEDGESLRVPTSVAGPVEAALGDRDGVLVVELKVPLAFSADSPHAVGTQAGKRISVGLETVEAKGKPGGSGEGGGATGLRAGTHGSGGFGFTGGGGGGGYGGGHGGGGGHHGGPPAGDGSKSRDLGKPIKEWLVVDLAAEPAPPPPAPTGTE